MHVLVILGMHRSGTSAVARVCNLLGADLGTHLMPAAAKNNPTGFWELQDIRDIHDELLRSLGSSWDDTARLPADWWQKSEISAFEARLIEVVRREFADATLTCLKDPRVCRLLPLWKRIFNRLKWMPHYLLVVRNPLEAARSLEIRDGFLPAKSQLLWLRHVLEAEDGTRGQKRAFISYEDLLRDWRGTIAPVWRQLGLDDLQIEAATAERIDGFLQRDLRHHAADLEDLENDERHSLIAAVYRNCLSAVEHDTAHNQHALSALHKVFEETASLYDPIVAAERERGSRLEAERHSLTVERHSLTVERHSLTVELSSVTSRLNQREGEVASLTEAAESRLVEIRRLTEETTERGEAIASILSSTSWRVTAPLRNVKTSVRRRGSGVGAMAMGCSRWLYRTLPIADQRKLRLRAYVLDRVPALAERLRGSIYRGADLAYEEWVEQYDTLNEADRINIGRHIGTFEHKPLISVIMPVFNPPERFLRAAIQSVTGQLYEHWELCIADDASTEPHVMRTLREYREDTRIKLVSRNVNGNISACSNSALELAAGEFIALMDHDDVLAEQALYRVVEAINTHPGAHLIYSDEDKIDEHNRRYNPYFKPDWGPDLFCGQNMINHLGVYRTSLVRQASGFRVGFEGSQDYDLALRIIERISPKTIVHIPHVLYHWRTTSAPASFSQIRLPRASSSARRALSEHFARTGVETSVESVPGVRHYQRIRRPVPKPAPLVSLIVPTRDKVALLRQCVDSILTRTHYANLEVIVVDNGSGEAETLAYLRTVQNDDRVRVLDYDREFNYSAINNFAIRQARGDIIGLINNDVVAINEDWLDELVSHAVRPEVGAVGAMLYYPDDTVQHAGIVMGIGGVAGHGHKHFKRGDPGYFGRLTLTHNVSGVTGACLLTRRNVFEECGELNESDLGVAFNDVDLCLRIRQLGYLIVWTPYAELYHLESASRGSDLTDEKAKRFNKEVAWMITQWGALLTRDPYYNPNLTLEKEDFSLAFPPRIFRPRDASTRN